MKPKLLSSKLEFLDFSIEFLYIHISIYSSYKFDNISFEKDLRFYWIYHIIYYSWLSKEIHHFSTWKILPFPAQVRSNPSYDILGFLFLKKKRRIRERKSKEKKKEKRQRTWKKKKEEHSGRYSNLTVSHVCHKPWFFHRRTKYAHTFPWKSLENNKRARYQGHKYSFSRDRISLSYPLGDFYRDKLRRRTPIASCQLFLRDDVSATALRCR